MLPKQSIIMLCFTSAAAHESCFTSAECPTSTEQRGRGISSMKQGVTLA
jgi:hypothetical protein